MRQKLKLVTITLSLLAGMLSPMWFSAGVYAAGAQTSCSGVSGSSKNCGSIPLGCPGTTKKGTVSKSAKITCPYTPSTGSTWTCKAAQCTFSNPVVTLGNGQSYPLAIDKAATSGNCMVISQCDLIKKYVNPLIELLSAFVGVAVVASIIIGGIQYSSAGGDASKVSAAKNRIRSALIALLVYLALYAILNFLIPGGIL